jgi:PKD repeat protein
MTIQIRNVVILLLSLVVIVPGITAAGTGNNMLLTGSVVSQSGVSVGGVAIYPSDDIWNVPVEQLPVDSYSAAYIQKIGSTSSLHPDFGAGLYDGNLMGIPYNIVSGSTPRKTITFDYADESDLGPYPIPDNPLIEGGSDKHILIVDRDSKTLYELFAAEKHTDGSWSAGSGAIFNLSDYALRPAGWTSADAAGLPILPGLVRYDEVASGSIDHAIRFTAPSTQRAFVWPARHYASSITDPSYPPMGQRFRLKTSFNTSGYSPQARVILEALKKYGMILADNGAPWYITGAPDNSWNNDVLHTLHQVKGSDFEAVDTSSLMINAGSGQARIMQTVIPFPGNTLPPTDVDHDGLFEDTNGNTRLDFSDVVLFFKNTAWIGSHEPVAAFDFNRNGSIDFNDLVVLFRKL